MYKLSQATTEAKAILGSLPIFDPLVLCFQHLEIEFGGIRCDRMCTCRTSRKKLEMLQGLRMHDLQGLLVEVEIHSHSINC